jgi:hypothetical protein
MSKCTVWVVAVSTLYLVGRIASQQGNNEKIAPNRAQLERAPLTIAVSTEGDFGTGRSWYLSVNSARQAELTIMTSNRICKKFEVTKEQLEEFRKALLDARFFELDREYGEHVEDGSERAVTVTAGRFTNTVRVNFLMNWVHNDKAKLRDPSRVVRLLVLLRGWLAEAEAVDLRKYDQMVLDAIKE